MQVERISADITLKHKPRTGTQAYNMLIESLKAEIQEKQEILSHLSQDKIKQKFIENWNPTTRSVNILLMLIWYLQRLGSVLLRVVNLLLNRLLTD